MISRGWFCNDSYSLSAVKCTRCLGAARRCYGRQDARAWSHLSLKRFTATRSPSSCCRESRCNFPADGSTCETPSLKSVELAAQHPNVSCVASGRRLHEINNDGNMDDTQLFGTDGHYRAAQCERAEHFQEILPACLLHIKKESPHPPRVDLRKIS